MKKNYVLDTNVLLHDPQSIFKFEDNDLILPIYVIEEIDTFKRDAAERGRNARTVVRLLDGLREKGGNLSDGVPIGDGGTLRVHVPIKKPVLHIALNPGTGDHAILQTTLDLRDAYPDRPTIFVTMDVSLPWTDDAVKKAAQGRFFATLIEELQRIPGELVLGGRERQHRLAGREVVPKDAGRGQVFHVVEPAVALLGVEEPPIPDRIVAVASVRARHERIRPCPAQRIRACDPTDRGRPRSSS